MPKIVLQPDDVGALPRLHPETKAAALVSLGRQKWLEVRDQVEHIKIGCRRFYSEAALAAFLRRHSVKPVAADQTPKPRVRKPPAAAAKTPAKPIKPRKAERERRPTA